MQFFSPKIILWVCKIEISTEAKEFNTSLFAFPKKTGFKTFSFDVGQLSNFQLWSHVGHYEKHFEVLVGQRRLQGDSKFGISSTFTCTCIWKNWFISKPDNGRNGISICRRQVLWITYVWYNLNKTQLQVIFYELIFEAKDPW